IPKNGGSSVHDQIRRFDERESFFFQRRDLPGHGRYDYAHLPLAYLRAHFPDDLETIRRLETFAVLRDPADRFVSALSQRARQHLKKTLAELDQGALDAEIGRIRDHLQEHPRYPEFAFVHFVPQQAYVELDGERVVTRLYPIERMPDLMRALEERLGVPLIHDFHANRTVTFRNPERRATLLKWKDKAKGALPTWAYFRLKELALPLFTEVGAGENAKRARATFENDALFQEYYADDNRLYAEIAGAHNKISKEGSPDACEHPDARPLAHDGGGQARQVERGRW
ncbi:MAG: hypothetical protein AAF698_08865, partial [Pseudomonadota bacterium]